MNLYGKPNQAIVVVEQVIVEPLSVGVGLDICNT